MLRNMFNQRFITMYLFAAVSFAMVLSITCAPLGGVDEKAFSTMLLVRRPEELGAPSEKDDQLELNKRAKEHLNWMKENANCKVPQPRVVHIQEEHPDSTVSYVPNAVVLHRCAQDAGCCFNDRQHCVPKSQEEVYLPINIVGQMPKDMPFMNHTQCVCEDL